jgi:hypothetical protein
LQQALLGDGQVARRAGFLGQHGVGDLMRDAPLRQKKPDRREVVWSGKIAANLMRDPALDSG